MSSAAANEMKQLELHRRVSVLNLFLSSSTLVCCALPALFVALGLGAAVATTVSAVPQLIWLSENKLLVFSVSGIMLVIGGVMHWQARSLPCPADVALAQACQRTRRISLWTYGASVLIYVWGATFAFALS